MVEVTQFVYLLILIIVVSSCSPIIYEREKHAPPLSSKLHEEISSLSFLCSSLTGFFTTTIPSRCDLMPSTTMTIFIIRIYRYYDLVTWCGLQDEVFISCRFSLTNDSNMVLYIAAVTGKEIPLN